MIDFDTLTRWLSSLLAEGQRTIMWISGVTGLSSGVVVVLLLAFGRGIADTIWSIVKAVILICAVVFLLSWWAESGHQLPFVESMLALAA